MYRSPLFSAPALFVFVFCTSLLTACSSLSPPTKVYPLEDLSARIPTDTVDVYLHPSDLQQAHREIAIISGHDRKPAFKRDAELDDLVAAMQEKARSIGADAIVIFRGDYTPQLSTEEAERRALNYAGGKSGETYSTPALSTRGSRSSSLATTWSLRVKAVVYE